MKYTYKQYIETIYIESIIYKKRNWSKERRKSLKTEVKLMSNNNDLRAPIEHENINKLALVTLQYVVTRIVYYNTF